MLLRVYVVLLFFCNSANAIILLGFGNTANQTDPGTGVPFNAVARVSNATVGSIGGSAVHLGGGWMITADHVGLIAFTTFDGATFYNRDVSVAPIQIGATDMKLFRLTTIPPVSAATVYSGSAENTGPATLIGFGRGRDPNSVVGSSTVAWSNSLNTSAKRWGLNRPAALITDSYTLNSKLYEQQTILTVLGSDPTGLGGNEAAVLTHDSGSGMFQQINGVWYLIGLAVRVEVSGSSEFGNDDISSPTRGDLNYFVRVSDYHAEIMGEMIPEPSITLLTVSLAMLCMLQRRRVS